MNNIKEKLKCLKSITGKQDYEENELKVIETKFKEFYEDLYYYEFKTTYRF